uniref:C-type lectin domain-containing protein n=1 Tax=Poecilia reticulata TaxID=8081 RepID=A0A3P9MXP4_POERE
SLYPLFCVLLSVASTQSHQYHFVNTLLTWTEAQSVCRRDYTDLATIESTADVDNFLNTTSGSSTVWIGLYREKLWSDGSDSLFRYWADGEPNDPSGDQCVAGSFNDSGRWSDENCSLSYPFICYKPNFSVLCSEQNLFSPCRDKL